MIVEKNVPLSKLTTMRIGGDAAIVMTVTSKDELLEAISQASAKDLPYFVLGQGSNVVAKGDNYPGVIILNRIRGFTKIAEDDNSTTIRIGAGEIWDDTVQTVCEMNLSGIESMSAIPGYTGATPVQNVGAYGQEIADTLTELEAYDTDSESFVTLSHDDCDFSYRNSIFKNPTERHHVIVSVTLRLRKQFLNPPFYPALEKYLDENNITDFSPQSIRSAVIAVRASKLPPVAEVASAGSFFKNPIVSQKEAIKLLAKFPDAPHWEMPGGVKLAAGWLIDRAGLKGFRSHGMLVYPNNALVLVNESAESFDDLAAFKSEIVAKVYGKFGVELSQEPEDLA